MIALQRRVFEENQRLIESTTEAADPEYPAYEETWRGFVSRAYEPADFAQLLRRVRNSDVVYVGDYHTFKLSQRTFLKLVRRAFTRKERLARLVIAVEAVQGRFQPALDRWIAGDLDEEEFREAVRLTEHLVFDNWPHYRPIFLFARELGIPMIGLDVAGEGLHSRDAYASERIAKTLLGRPGSQVVVLGGELHITPLHLPARVRTAMAARHRTIRDLVVYQNPHPIYWSLAEGGLEHEVEVVRLEHRSYRQYAIMNAPPVVLQQSYMAWLHGEEEDDYLEGDTLAETEAFARFARLIADYLELDAPRAEGPAPVDIAAAIDRVRVFSPGDLSFLEELRTLEERPFTDREISAVHRQILSNESYFIPRGPFVYLANTSVNHAAEEASHFLRSVCAGEEGELSLLDAFYSRILHEALGFFGSKIVNNRRKAAHEPFFRELLRRHAGQAPRRRDLSVPDDPTDEEALLGRFVLEHKAMERGQASPLLDQVYGADADMFFKVTHVLGYILGDKLYYALVRGRITKKEARDLYFEDFESEGHALALYLYLVARIGRVRIPRRV